jgi:hypothetical protein
MTPGREWSHVTGLKMAILLLWLRYEEKPRPHLKEQQAGGKEESTTFTIKRERKG